MNIFGSVDSRIDLITPTWGKIFSRFPRQFWSVVSFTVGFIWTIKCLVSKRNTLPVILAIKSSCRVSNIRSFLIYLNSNCNSARTVLDFASIVRASPTSITGHISSNTSFQNIEEINSTISQDKPVILLLGSFALHYYGLLTDTKFSGNKIADVCVVQPSVALYPLNEMKFYDHLSAISGRKIEGLTADSPAVAVHICRALAARKIVVMRIDSLPTKTSSFLVADLLGKPAMFPLSVLTIAQKNKCRVNSLFY